MLSSKPREKDAREHFGTIPGTVRQRVKHEGVVSTMRRDIKVNCAPQPQNGGHLPILHLFCINVLWQAVPQRFRSGNRST